MGKNLKIFAFQFETVGLLDGFVGLLFFLILNIAYATTCSVVVTFELTFDDCAKFGINVVECFLTNGDGDVSDEDVGFRVGFMIGLD